MTVTRENRRAGRFERWGKGERGGSSKEIAKRSLLSVLCRGGSRVELASQAI